MAVRFVLEQQGHIAEDEEEGRPGVIPGAKRSFGVEILFERDDTGDWAKILSFGPPHGLDFGMYA